MSVPLIGVITAGVAVVVLTGLFGYEQSRGVRFFRPFREWLDMLVRALETRFKHATAFFRRNVVRQVVHYLFHVVLAAVLCMLKRVEVFVESILRRNRAYARTLSTSRTKRSVFDEIQEHKRSVALTDAEKKKRRMETLEGK